MRSLFSSVVVALFVAGCNLQNDTDSQTQSTFSVSVAIENACGSVTPNPNAYFIVHNDDFSTKEFVYANRDGFIEYTSPNASETISLVREAKVLTQPKVEITTYTDIQPKDLGVIIQTSATVENCICSDYDMSVIFPEEVNFDDNSVAESVEWRAKDKGQLKADGSAKYLTYNEVQFQNFEYCVNNVNEPQMFSASTNVDISSWRTKRNEKYLGYVLSPRPPESISASISTTEKSLSFTDYEHNPTSVGDLCAPFDTKFQYSTLINEMWLDAAQHSFSNNKVYNNESVSLFELPEAQKYKASLFTLINLNRPSETNYNTFASAKTTTFYDSAKHNIYQSLNQHSGLDINTLFAEANESYDLTEHNFDTLVVSFSKFDSELPDYLNVATLEWKIIAPAAGTALNLSNMQLDLASDIHQQVPSLTFSPLHLKISAVDFSWVNDYQESIDYLEVLAPEVASSKVLDLGDHSYINELTVWTQLFDVNFDTSDAITFKQLWREGYEFEDGFVCY
ncbi:MAG: hypothetical protein HWE10_14285 [Gammaproteobacteria bacterium]|nr:hypothetical protein [Gammaproteobacteria bacterium]